MTDNRVKYVSMDGIYARAGEWVTCEWQHPICMFTKTAKVGETFKPDDLANWYQTVPNVGTIDVPGCQHCGKPYWRPGNEFHFYDGWRRVGQRSLWDKVLDFIRDWIWQ